MLTNGQKSYLAQLAKRAYAKCVVVGGADDGISEEDWRHREVAAACGKNGLKCCGQYDYKLVEGHFLNLLGETGRALKSFVRAASEPKRQAEVVLVRALEEFHFTHDYAEGICRQAFKCSVSEAGANQVWMVVYAVRRAGQRKRKQLKEIPA